MPITNWSIFSALYTICKAWTHSKMSTMHNAIWGIWFPPCFFSSSGKSGANNTLFCWEKEQCQNFVICMYHLWLIVCFIFEFYFKWRKTIYLHNISPIEVWQPHLAHSSPTPPTLPLLVYPGCFEIIYTLQFTPFFGKNNFGSNLVHV